eukprot:15460171-Alexandrium_andersonii.AAC.1
MFRSPSPPSSGDNAKPPCSYRATVWLPSQYAATEPASYSAVHGLRCWVRRHSVRGIRRRRRSRPASAPEATCTDLTNMRVQAIQTAHAVQAILAIRVMRARSWPQQ